MVGNKLVRISRIDIKTELISDPQKGQLGSSISTYRLRSHNRGNKITEPGIGLLRAD